MNTNEFTQSVQNKASSVKEAVSEKASQMGEQVKKATHDAVETVNEQLSECSKTMAETVKENPLLSIGVAILGGILIGALITK